MPYKCTKCKATTWNPMKVTNLCEIDGKVHTWQVME